MKIVLKVAALAFALAMLGFAMCTAQKAATSGAANPAVSKSGAPAPRPSRVDYLPASKAGPPFAGTYDFPDDKESVKPQVQQNAAPANLRQNAAPPQLQSLPQQAAP